MKKLRSDTDQPGFNSLSGIMDRFYSVPYEQFQQELDDWFKNRMSEKGPYPANSELNGICKFSSVTSLISKIYHHAELLKTVSESSINMPDDRE